MVELSFYHWKIDISNLLKISISGFFFLKCILVVRENVLHSLPIYIPQPKARPGLWYVSPLWAEDVVVLM
jgi:hypothetical protein